LINKEERLREKLEGKRRPVNKEEDIA